MSFDPKARIKDQTTGMPYTWQDSMITQHSMTFRNLSAHTQFGLESEKRQRPVYSLTIGKYFRIEGTHLGGNAGWLVSTATKTFDLLNLSDLLNTMFHNTASRGKGTPLRISEKYAPVGKIGEGTYGLVYKARPVQPPPNGTTGEAFVAVKKFKSFKSGDGISPTAIREIKLLRELKNRYIVDLVDVMLDEQDKSLYLVFDYAEHDLLEMIRWHHAHNSQPMPMQTVKSLLWQILQGMNYLHMNWIIHRDLKPSNILVTGHDKPPSERGCVKIADFGLARLFQAPLRPLTDVDAVVVTIWYRAPELLLGAKHYTKAIDLWAIGCIFAELITSKPLFQGVERERKGGDDRNPFQADQIDKIFRILGKPTVEQWPSIVEHPHWHQAQNWVNHPRVLQDRIRGLPEGSQGYDLLSKLLEYDPTQRITAENALKHPFFTEEPLPQRVAFLDPNTDPYKSRPVTALDPKKDMGWAMSASKYGKSRGGSRSTASSSVPSLSSAPPPSKRSRTAK